MATFKAEVYAHQKKQDGTWNIKIRVFHNGRKRYIATSWYVTKEDLTRSLKLKNQTYIDYTDDLIKKYRQKCDRAGERLKGMTVDEVVELLENEQDGEQFDLDIVAYGRGIVSRLRATGHEGNALSYEGALNNLVRFVGRESVSVKEVTARFIQDWIDWIAAQPARKNRKKGSRAQSLYPSQLRAILNQAKAEFNDEDAGIIRIPQSPFKKVKLPKVEQARWRAITLEQVKALRDLPDTKILQPGQNRRNLARDAWLISFYLVGMNEADMYECEDCNGGRITYQRKKTRNRRADRAEISLEIQPELEPLLAKYRDQSGQRVFCFYKMYSSINTFTTSLNKGLKSIGEELGIDDLEFYSARHTWATLAVNEAGVDKYTVHTALNHVDEKLRVTDVYIKKSWKPLDAANRKVLDLLKQKTKRVKNQRFK